MPSSTPMPEPGPDQQAVDRRRFLALCSGLSLASGALPELLWATAEQNGGTLSKEDLQHAERLAGLELTDSERDLMLAGLQELRQDYQQLRQVPLDNTVPPALRFDPLLPERRPPERRPPAGSDLLRLSRPADDRRPEDPDELAFLPVTRLSRLIRDRRLSSLELTRLFLERLQRFDPTLHCVITLTEERALRQAEQADQELARGVWRGPLHGIPWGAKDLLAVRGYPTTWGAAPFQDQVIDSDASVVQRLDRAGAVLLAKLSVGALAWGDVWFGETTRNPWNPEQGSSGSSAGPAAATAAGLVGFSIGTETWGSIVSPATRCGVTGLRPTFGRISRYGCMALSWSMDKVGPICRSVEDCAMVLAAIHGADGHDPSAVDVPFAWDAGLDPRRLRVGYTRSLFEDEPEEEAAREWRRLDRQALQVLRAEGIELIPIELPDLPVGSLSFILSAEAAAAFDELTRSGRDDEMVRQVEHAWPNVFRQARLIPAVEYLQANRVRTLLMREMERLFDEVDLYVSPTYGGDNLLLSNLTGHPEITVPSGFRADGTPVSITFTGKLFGEAELLALARLYQETSRFHLQHPPLGA